MADDAEDTDRVSEDDADGGHADDDRSDSAPDADASAGTPADADSDASTVGSDEAAEAAEDPAADADSKTDPDADDGSAGETDDGAGGEEASNASAESGPDSDSDSSPDPGPDSGADASVDSPTETPDIHPRAEEVADAATPDDGDAPSTADADADAGADTETGSDAEASDADAPSVADLAADASADSGEPDADEDSDADSGSTLDADTESEIGPSSEEIVAGTDGGASVNAGETGVADPVPAVDEGYEPEGPESDEEMPLADHIEEMIRRLAVVLGIGGIVTLLLYPGADLVNSAFGLDLVSSTEVIDFLWNKHIPGAPEMVDRRPRVYGPLELLLTELKVAALGGLLVGLPAFVYETYLFMRPGLYPKERRYYLAAVPTSLILAFIGIAFAHFIVLPAIFAYFTSYTTGTALVAFGLKETFNLILILMGYNAIIFQIPLFVMLAIMMNLVTRTWMEDRRLLFWGTFLGLAFLVSPDPTGMAPIIIALTMIGLFEGTLLALRWTGTGN